MADLEALTAAQLSKAAYPNNPNSIVSSLFDIRFRLQVGSVFINRTAYCVRLLRFSLNRLLKYP